MVDFFWYFSRNLCKDGLCFSPLFYVLVNELTLSGKNVMQRNDLSPVYDFVLPAIEEEMVVSCLLSMCVEKPLSPELIRSGGFFVCGIHEKKVPNVALRFSSGPLCSMAWL